MGLHSTTRFVLAGAPLFSRRAARSPLTTTSIRSFRRANGLQAPPLSRCVWLFSASASTTAGDGAQRIAFLGTPSVAARALQLILDRLNEPVGTTPVAGLAKVVGTVSQPPARSGRGKQLLPSPVHALAEANNIPVLTPESASERLFLEQFADWRPDVCITAAYGCILPDSFLAIPRCGTLNIHPSLLPKYRGAAPVQRCVEAGDAETGVSIVYTVKKLDAGPLVAQKTIPMPSDLKSPDILEHLFELGAELLLDVLPDVLQGKETRTEQDHSAATIAKKLSVAESHLSFDLPASVLHNKVRAFAGWPTTKAAFLLDDAPFEMKIVTTRIPSPDSPIKIDPSDPHTVVFANDAFQIACGDGSVLEVLEVQVPGKRVFSAREYNNGLRSKHLRRV